MRTRRARARVHTRACVYVYAKHFSCPFAIDFLGTFLDDFNTKMYIHVYREKLYKSFR